MGTKVQIESGFPGYFSMRDLNEDSNSCGWPLYYEDRTFTNGQYYNGFLPRTVVDVYSDYDKDLVKRTMLEHEAIFKNQLCELHRLYRIQRDLMDEARRKELSKSRMAVETSLSSGPLASQITSEDARKWHILGNSIEDMHSPLSSMKGSSIQASPLLSQNAGTSKDVEAFESRPTKVRRKMFDLHLPADVYIDTEVGEQMDGNACLKSKSNLADLNEPVEAEDKNASSNDRLGCSSSHYEIEELELGAKLKSEFLGFPQEVVVNSHKDTSNGALIDPYLQNNDDGKLWFPHMPDSGHSKNNFLSATRDFQPGKMPSSSATIQVIPNKHYESATLFLPNQTNAGQLREIRTVHHGSQLSERNKDSLTPTSLVTSNNPSQYRVDHSSDLSKSWSHSITSWEKHNGAVNQKSMPVQVHPCIDSLSRSCQSSTQSHGAFGNRWNYNANSASYLRTQSDLPDKNGFYHGSSSGSKELLIKFPSVNYDYLNCTSASNAAPENFINQNKSSNYLELKGAKEVNLNSNGQKRMEVIDLEKNPDDDDDDDDDDVVTLPWLRAKPNCKKEPSYAGVDLNADMNSLNLSSHVTESGMLPNQHNTKPASCSRIGAIDDSSCKKILGFPIFEKPHSSKMESSTLTSLSEVVENDRKNRVLDINLPCDQEVADTVAQTAALEKEVACARHQIDLNSCVTEDEAGLTPSVTGSNVKTISGIDLEAPAVAEDEEAGQECMEMGSSLEPDECVRTAAEAIITISLSGKDIHQDNVASMTDPLQWFVEIVSSFGEDGPENKYEGYYSSEDYFESMTLRLEETKQEDYMPKPLVPENLVLPEATAPLLTTRPRRGSARRGRQRRDFQRDILPGLVSLSRHEVTEDLQTFEGMMKGTGHLWHSGPARRNGCGRGRRRSLVNAPPAAPPPPPPPLVEQLNNVEGGLEDRNLRGWGKTTRRPRRQRCPPALPLT